MRDYYRDRSLYRMGNLIGIGICLYLYVFQTRIGCWLCGGDEELATMVWPICIVALYGIGAFIRRSVLGEWYYTGILRVLPKLFIGYMLLGIIPTLWEQFF